MSAVEKTAKIIDLNLFSGSSDTMRTNLGGFWEIVSVNISSIILPPGGGEGTYTSIGETVEEVPFDLSALPNPFLIKYLVICIHPHGFQMMLLFPLLNFL